MPPEQTSSLSHTTPPQAPHHTAKLWMILAIIAALLAIGLGSALWYTLSQQQPQANTQTPTTTTPAAATTEQLATSFRPAGSAKLYTLSLTAPKEWRTINATGNAQYRSDPLVDSANEVPLLLQMLPDEAQNVAKGAELKAESELRMRDVTEWLKASDGDSTAAQRQKAFDYIVSLGTSTEPKQMTGDNKGLIDINPTLRAGNFVRPKAVATKDGSLKGVVYVTSGTQGIGYDPMAVVTMAGTVDGKKVILSGFMLIRDAAYKTLSASQDQAAIAKAQSSFNNGTIPDDAAASYQRIIDALGTLEIKQQ